MRAVIRRAHYHPEALATGQERLTEFERVHAAQPGYAGNLVVDLGGGERLLVTLWASDSEAGAARSQLGPVVQELLGPLERAPSDLVGTGPVIRCDLGLNPKRPAPADHAAASPPRHDE